MSKVQMHLPGTHPWTGKQNFSKCLLLVLKWAWQVLVDKAGSGRSTTKWKRTQIAWPWLGCYVDCFSWGSVLNCKALMQAFQFNGQSFRNRVCHWQLATDVCWPTGDMARCHVCWWHTRVSLVALRSLQVSLKEPGRLLMWRLWVGQQWNLSAVSYPCVAV